MIGEQLCPVNVLKDSLPFVKLIITYKATYLFEVVILKQIVEPVPSCSAGSRSRSIAMAIERT